MTPTLAAAALLGTVFGFGCWALISLIPILNRPRLLHRVAPYVVDVSPGARELLARVPVNPLPVVGTLLTPVTDRLRRLSSGLLGGDAEVRIRLRQAGSPLTIEGYRSRQLLWALLGIGLGVVAALAVHRVQSLPVVMLVALVAIAGCLGVVLRDQLLHRAARARLARMVTELPTVLEFLTLSLSAGEGVLDSIRRVARVSTGELATELSRTVSAVNTGLPFSDSLQKLADDLQLVPLSRCVEQIVGAIERGTPLVEVLRSQAQDARDEAKRSLLETAGKKEVAMLVPLVFLILPVTILFAIYPGIFVLRLGF